MLPETGEAEFILLHSDLNPWPMTREELEQMVARPGPYEPVVREAGLVLMRRVSLSPE
jgi:hypothetical protein